MSTNGTGVVEWTLAPRARRIARAPQAADEEPRRPVLARLPRVTRLMALAVKFEQMIRDGVVADFAELARLGRVTRARMTQIMNLLNLAPDIQEEILFMARVREGRAPVTERGLRRIASELDWGVQRALWSEVRGGDADHTIYARALPDAETL